jgi:hypothetical protein
VEIKEHFMEICAAKNEAGALTSESGSSPRREVARAASSAQNTMEGSFTFTQQAQHKITPRFCEYEVVVDEYGNLGCGNCHLCDYPA